MTRPPATTDAICPETLAPAACIRMMFDGSSLSAIFCTTRADIGNAEIPAAPIIGLIFFLRKRLMNFANNTPPIESSMNAASPSAMMSNVSAETNCSACMLNETLMPRSRVIKFVRAVRAVSASESSTPHSRTRLPNMRKPTSDTEAGAMSPVIMVTTTGNAMRTPFDTSLPLYSILIIRSFFVVTILIASGCTTGTSAIYEYAATAMAPTYFEWSTCETRIEVGPSAAPMMPIDAASRSGNPSSTAQEEHRLCKKRPEVSHRANSNEQQQRKRFRCRKPRCVQPLDDAARNARAGNHLVEYAGHRQVHENRAESHR